MPLPALRNLDVFPVQYQGAERYALKDPSGLSDRVLVLTFPALFIASCLDGKNGIEEIQKAFEKRFDGGGASREDIEGVVWTLDEAFLLESPRYRSRVLKIEEDYRSRPTRPTAHAGLAYEAEASALEAQLEGYFESPGPGPARPGSAEGELIGLVAPHIDFQRGGSSYAWAYREILSRSLADLYVVLGVAHSGPPAHFVLTSKAYDTPFGPAEVDAGLAESLRVRSLDPLEHELAHRGEHSIEFQTVWLKFAEKRLGRPIRILPILCTSLGGSDRSKPDPAADLFLDRLAKKLTAYRGKVCLLAGVDLAHVGRRFGDSEPAADLVPWMEKGDRSSLERVLSKDAAGFYASVMEDGGKRKVCGLGALYAFCRLLKRLAPESKGTLLRYDHKPDPNGGEVSFASLSFVR